MYREVEALISFQEAFNQRKPEALQFEKNLNDDIFCIQEIIRYLRWLKLNHRDNFTSNSLVRDICYSLPRLESQVRQRFHRILTKFMSFDLVDLSLIDTSENTSHKMVTEYGWRSIEDETIFHLVLGTSYTLKRCSDSIAILKGPMNRKTSREPTGSAIHLGKGYFLTCEHCCEKKPVHLAIKSKPEEFFNATVLQTDRETDVALIHVPEFSDLPAIKISETSSATLAHVLVLHFPSIPNLVPSLIATCGEVNGTAVNYLRQSKLDLLISARTAPGSSGGAVLSSEGKLIGMVRGSAVEVGGTASNPDEGTWRAEPFYHVIPVDQLRPILKYRRES